jgi:hypothetical protein
MDGNLNGKDSERASMNAANLTNVDFSLADQREVAATATLIRNEKVVGLVLDNSDTERHAKFDQPHNWYASVSKSYSLPNETIPIHGMQPTIRAGWRNQYDKRDS